MPKKIMPDEVYDEEEEDYDEEEEEEEEPVVKAKKKVSVPVHRKNPTTRPVQVQKRYVGFHQQAADGIVDSETQEIISTDLWDALADMKSQLDRIENAIGVMQ